MPEEIYYRYHDILVSDGYDYESDTSFDSHVEIQCTEYTVDKHTQKGVWISPLYGLFDFDKHFILLSATKKFAHPNKSDAMKSFLARKNRQLRILKEKVNQVEQAIEVAKNYDVNKPDSTLNPNWY